MTYKAARNLCSLLLVLTVAACASSPAVPKRNAPAAASSAVFFPADTGSFTKAEFDLHIIQLKKRLPSNDFYDRRSAAVCRRG